MNYAMLAEPLAIRNKSAMTPDSYIGVFGEINLVNGLIYSEEKEFTEIVNSPKPNDFPARNSRNYDLLH